MVQIAKMLPPVRTRNSNLYVDYEIVLINIFNKKKKRVCKKFTSYNLYLHLILLFTLSFSVSDNQQ